MNRPRRMMIALCFATLARVSAAQTTSLPPVSQNIVTLNFNAAVLQTTEAQKQLTELQTHLAPRQAQLKALNDEVETLRKQLANTSDNLTDAERAKREQTLDAKEKQLQRQVEDFRNDSQSESGQIFQQVAQKVYVFLQNFSKQHSYSAVIDRGSDAQPIVWYVANNIDITDQLIKAYNAQPSGAIPSSPNPAGPLKAPTHNH